MISFATSEPLKQAVEQLRRKTPMGTDLTSSQLADLPAELRDRAMFSARVEEERILAEMQERLQARIELAKRDGRTMDRGVFVEEMREVLRAEGYRRPEGIKSDSLRNLKSTARLGLIFDMNVAQAEGFARWAADMTPEGLENEPCNELIRWEQRMEIRNWPRVWAALGGEFYGDPGSNPDYPQSAGRMIAKKTDPIWNNLSRFNTPWPPFDWGSGMGLRGVDRFESDELGVTREDETFTPLERPFNEGYQMSVRTLPESARERIRSSFGDAIRFDGNEIILQRNTTPENYEQRKQDLETSAQERSRSYFLQASDELERLQRGNDGAELGFRAEGEIEIARAHLAQISAVAVGRKQLFHDTMTDEESDTLLRAIKDLPKELGFHRRDGHVIAWRRDSLDLDADELIDQMELGAGGLLLGYGRDTMAIGEAHTLVRIYRAADPTTPITGFHAPIGDWKSYADSRAKDLSLAFAEDMLITHMEVRP